MKYFIFGILLSLNCQAGLSEENLLLCMKSVDRLHEVFVRYESCGVNTIGAKVEISQFKENCYEVYRNSIKLYKMKPEK